MDQNERIILSLFGVDPIFQSIIWIFFIFLIVIVITVVLRMIYRRKDVHRSRWLNLVNFMSKRDLTPTDIALVRIWFETLPFSKTEEIIFERRRLHSELFHFLSSHNETSAEAKVRLMDKLFPALDNSNQTEIKSEGDVQPGETAAVECKGKHFLATVVDRDIIKGRVLLSCDHEINAPLSGDCAVYIYRYHLGGFLIHGKISRSGQSAYNFSFSGSVEFRGDQHLMAKMNLHLVISSWPVKEQPAETANETSEIMPLNFILTASSEVISDRAILFSLGNEADTVLLKKSEIWELRTDLPSGFKITVRGLIIPSQKTIGRFIFKFTDISETARRVVFEEIRDFSPVRESLG